ncbi:MAG TPA: hypothetical protein DCY24_05290, partial [Rikenellaceae bacterium]|nr:hypothetical protein [Rikenellaceae bacterium]
MNEKIVQMVKLAIESGTVSPKHRELILNKAKEVGEDPDLVEMYLDNELAKLSDSRTAVSHETKGVKKCPHCGAPITDTMLSCPECGFVFQKENKASEDVRERIDKLEEALSEAAIPRQGGLLYTDEPSQRMVPIINSFTLPYTKEGLVQMLELSYSNYVSTDNTIGTDGMRPVRKAWYGKAIQALNALSRFEDGEIQTVVSHYKSLLRSEKRKLRFDPVLGVCIPIFIFGAVITGVGMNKDNKAVEKMRECIEMHDYTGARAAIHKYSGTTDDY